MKINTYGLVYHWEGKNRSLKPLLLAAHQGKPLSNVNGAKSFVP